jgi:peptidoglycan/LPS O-acetylase OafA/YrhL
MTSSEPRPLAAARSPRTLPRIIELDGLRGLAILLVMLLHFRLLRCGWIGVQLFFVLSGFLITRILRSSRDLPLRLYLGQFYRNRALRILPVYFAYLGVIGGVFLLIGGPQVFRQIWPYLVTFTVNFTRAWHDWIGHPSTTPLWSLSVEEQFYLLWPFVVRRLSDRQMKRFVIGLVLGAPVFRWWYALYLADGVRSAYDVGDTVYWQTLSHVDAFALGGLVAIVSLSGASMRLAVRSVGPMAALTLVAGLANLYSSWPSLRGDLLQRVTSFGYFLSGLGNGQHVWGYTLLNLTTACCLGAVAGNELRTGHPLRALLSQRWLREIGRVSYGMYLCHFAIASLVPASWSQGSLRKVLLFGPYLAVVYAVAYLSHRYFEARFAALRAEPA